MQRRFTSVGRSLVLALSAAAAVQGCGGESTSDGQAAAGNAGSGAGSGAGGAASGGEGNGGSSQGGSGNDSGWGPPPSTPPTAVDLLFVVDNSLTMADKQVLLADALPRFVSGLTAPEGSEFPGVADLHLGVITTSLGGHGGEVCADDPSRPRSNDRAHLLGTVRAGLESWNSQGFLAWDPGATHSPAGESDATALLTSFRDHVLAAGEDGCGYEATLEAWYRFLVDPEPAESVIVENGVSTKQGTDETVLAQRAAFLRPDSLLGVVILTDENDCSIMDEGMGWAVGTVANGFRMPRATSACAEDPNDVCCRSCASTADTPEGCAPAAEDDQCLLGAGLPIEEDELNVRCFDQKRRFGVDFLYPIQRYVDGLSSKLVPNRDGELVENPLLANRHPSRVFVTGIVGVPWQDIATESSWSGEGLKLLTAAELEAEGRWDVMLGDPEKGILPTDPLMVESIDPRSGTHPLLDVDVAPPDSTDPQQNPINGHEMNAALWRDLLQYTCIFPLTEPRDCSNTEMPCNCTADNLERNDPTCNPPSGGPAGTTQFFARAYPGVRHLQFLKAMGERSIVGSVCAKDVEGDAASESYGYNAVANSLVSYIAGIMNP